MNHSIVVVVVVALESHHKSSNTSSVIVWWQMKKEESQASGWGQCFNIVGCITAHKETLPLILKGSSLE